MDNSRRSFFRAVSLVVALVYSICFFRNNTGIACTIFGIFMAAFLWWYIKSRKKRNIMLWDYIYGVLLIMLGMMPAYTDNEFVMHISKMIFAIITIKWALQIAYGIERLSFMRNIYAIIEFVIKAFTSIFKAFPGTNTDSGLEGRSNHEIYEFLFQKMNNNGEQNTKSDMISETETKNSYRNQIMLGIIIAIPVLLLVLALLSSADAMFAQIMSNLFIGIENIEDIVSWLLFLGVTFLGVYGCAKAVALRRVNVSDTDMKKAGVVTGITFTGIFSAVYILFCMVQMITILTNGSMLPDDYTYAQYARTGFFELLFVCIINVCMVILCRIKFEVNKTLKVLLTVISVCTYFMTGSSAYRMILYIDKYSLTFLRVLVLWALATIALVMTMVIWFIYNERISLFEYCLVLCTVMFIIFGAIKPDNIIMSYNIAHFGNGISDAYYIFNELSMDGTRSLIEAELGPTYDHDLEYYCEQMVIRYKKKYKGDIRKFNWSRYKAYTAALDYLDKK